MKKKEKIKAIPKEEKLIEKIKEEKKEEVKIEEKPAFVEEYPAFVEFSKMNDREMEHYLFELSSTIYWQAILKFIRQRDGDILTTLISLDPFAQPTLVSRNQGERVGIYDIENFINSLIEKIREENKSKQEKEADDKKVPGYGNW
jgi:hypothetical protein